MSGISMATSPIVTQPPPSYAPAPLLNTHDYGDQIIDQTIGGELGWQGQNPYSGGIDAGNMPQPFTGVTVSFPSSKNFMNMGPVGSDNGIGYTAAAFQSANATYPTKEQVYASITGTPMSAISGDGVSHNG